VCGADTSRPACFRGGAMTAFSVRDSRMAGNRVAAAWLVIPGWPVCRLADGAAVEACGLQGVGRVEDFCRDWVAWVDEAGGGVCL